MLNQYQDISGILLVPTSKKMSILKEVAKLDGIPSFQVMTFDLFRQNFFFCQKEKALHYLVIKKKIKVSIAEIYLDSLYEIEDKQYRTDKLKELVLLKRELEQAGLFTPNPSFLTSLQNKRILVYPSTLDDRTSYLLKKIESTVEVIFLEEDEVPLVEREVLSFETAEAEVRFVARQILNLRKQGVPFSSIHLLQAGSEYSSLLPRLFSFYHIPHMPLETSTLYASVTGQAFLSLMEQGVPLSEIVEQLKDKPYLAEIVRLSNAYLFLEGNPSLQKEFLIQSLKKTHCNASQFEDMVQVDSLYLDYQETDYVFLLGFNQENIPKIWKDEEYLNDFEKREVGLMDTTSKNKQERMRLRTFLSRVPNLTITYKKKTAFLSFYPSSFISECGFTVKAGPTDFSEIASDIDTKLQYATLLDHFMKYGEKSEILNKYYSHYLDYPYLTYENQFTGLSKELLTAHLKENLLLSYSSLDQFHRCSFRYYVGQILKLQEYEETFAQEIGTIFHELLAQAFIEGFSLDTSFEQLVNSKTRTKKEMFLLRKLKEELRFVIETIQEQQNSSALTKAFYEKKIYLPKNREIKVTFMGIVDKLLFSEKDGLTSVAIIDYKTGTPETNISNTIYGIEMQLPIYLYLVKNSDLFSQVKFVGFYLQKILHPEISVQSRRTYEEIKKDHLKLSGYSSNEEYLVEKLDINYQNSTVVQGLKTTSKGFAHYSKVMSEEDMDQLLELVDERIEEAITRILQTDFLINPKVIGFHHKGCEFCPFAELCYKTDKNRVYLKEYQGLDFLGGETHAEMDNGTTECD